MQMGWHLLVVVQYTFTLKQYNKNDTEYLQWNIPNYKET
jgi:hypothetical protein